jgi:hypothetical protein
MNAYLQVWPAYGRKYDTPQAAREGFQAGQDFSCSRGGGPYMSIRDFKEPAMTHFKGVRIVQNLPIIDTIVEKK